MTRFYHDNPDKYDKSTTKRELKFVNNKTD